MFQIKKKLTTVLGAVVFLAMAGSAYAQFSGPGSAPKDSIKDTTTRAATIEQNTTRDATARVVTVKEIMQNPVDNQEVMVQGFLTQKIDKKYYQFTDGTGEIRVEISPRRFNRQNINERTKVELLGKLDVDRESRVKIEVKRVTVLAP